MRVKQSLTLARRAGLPTHCYFIAHAQKADVLWTRHDFRSICHRMLNGNSEHDFLMAYRDKTGAAKFSKAFKAKASERIDWAFDTICGTASSKTGIGFYPTNSDDESCWGALDFDAHNPDERVGRAYKFAGKAFDLLCNEAPQLWTIAGTSGESGGWHIFVFSEDFYSTGEWARLLREVADRIGAPIQKGICEIFPDGTTRGLGYGIRAPGTWNPKDDSYGLIAADFASPRLKELYRASLPITHKQNISLYANYPPREEKVGIVNRAKGLYRGQRGEWKGKFAITASRTRHEKLTKLIGTAFFQTSKERARQNAEFQYLEATVAPSTPLPDHLAEFDDAWQGMERQWLKNLAPAERTKFDALTTEAERDAFRIIRGWSQNKPQEPDFKIHCETLGWQVGLKVSGTGKLRKRFCDRGIIRQTAPFVRHKLAARYKWIAADEPNRKQTAFVSSQWNGDPGDARTEQRKHLS